MKYLLTLLIMLFISISVFAEIKIGKIRFTVLTKSPTDQTKIYRINSITYRDADISINHLDSKYKCSFGCENTWRRADIDLKTNKIFLNFYEVGNSSADNPLFSLYLGRAAFKIIRGIYQTGELHFTDDLKISAKGSVSKLRFIRLDPDQPFGFLRCRIQKGKMKFEQNGLTVEVKQRDKYYDCIE